MATTYETKHVSLKIAGYHIRGFADLAYCRPTERPMIQCAVCRFVKVPGSAASGWYDVTPRSKEDGLPTHFCPKCSPGLFVHLDKVMESKPETEMVAVWRVDLEFARRVMKWVYLLSRDRSFAGINHQFVAGAHEWLIAIEPLLANTNAPLERDTMSSDEALAIYRDGISGTVPLPSRQLPFEPPTEGES